MSSGASKQSNIQSSSAPWAQQQPFLTDVFGKAQAQYNQGPQQFFPNSTVTPFSNQTNQVLTGLENTANDPNSLVAKAQTNLGQTLGGDFLNSGNPAFGAMMDRVSNQIRPKLDAQFNGANYGGSLHQGAMSSALADAGANLAFQNYSQERGNQMQGLMQAPGLNTAQLDPLAKVGQIREGQANAELGDQIQRFNFNQNAPDDALRRYMTLVGGGSYGSQGTQTQPSYSDPWATGLGLASSAAGIAGSLFGKFGKGGLF